MDEQASLRRKYKAFRKALLSYTPLIRRSRHERAMARLKRHYDHEKQRYFDMARVLCIPPSPAGTAPYTMLVPMSDLATDDLCLFVSHVAGPELKPHVVEHVNALLNEGIQVVLIANADLEPADLKLPADLLAKLYGCLVRKNVGFDFAAWAHAYGLIKRELVRRRLFVVNDSIVGPLDLQAYRALLDRVRESSADLIGLTINPDPHDHLQSYYLVFNERLLHSQFVDAFFRGVLNMPTKQNVIDCYEIWLSAIVEEKGFSTVAIFPRVATDPPRRNDTVFNWSKLIDLGFPFIKGMVLRDPIEGEAARLRIPAKYL